MPMTIAFFRMGAGSPAAAMPTTIALSPARATSMAMTDASAQRASALRYSATETRSEEHTSELQSLMRTSYAVFCLKKTTKVITKSASATKQTKIKKQTTKH